MSRIKRPLCWIICWCAALSSASAQEVLDRLVTVRSEEQSIASVLSLIEDRYQIFFTYSKNYIPVDKKVSFYHLQTPLRDVLEEMFQQTAVVFVARRGKIILKIDPEKEELLQQQRIYEEIRKKQEALISARNKEKERLKLDPLSRRSHKLLDRPGNDASLVIDWEKYKFPPLPQEEDEPDLKPLPDMGVERKLAQASIFPFLGTNKLYSDEITNRLSFNLFWGLNGGVDGLEVGMFLNSIKNQVQGVQLAGMGNTVGGKLEGVQLAGMGNTVGGKLEGVQLAGLFNVVAGEVEGVQAAGLFNVAGQSRSAVQMAGLMNVGAGEVRTQMAGLFNVAENVDGAQLSALLNVANRVDGFQLGLINVADSISGVPIGLLNFIKNGYNRVEFSANETFLGNFALRIGVRKFYNILIIGGRIDNGRVNNNPNAQEVSFSWGLGYGLGKGITMGSRNNMLCLEAIVMHVNEGSFWTSSLNLWNQYRLGFDFQTGRRTSVFFGPTMNVLFSKLYNSDSSTTGSGIMPYTFYDETKGRTNVKMWAGFGLGVRF